MATKEGHAFLQRKAKAMRDGALHYFCHNTDVSVKQYVMRLKAVIASSPRTTEEEIIVLIDWLDDMHAHAHHENAREAVFEVQIPLLAKLERLSRGGHMY